MALTLGHKLDAGTLALWRLDEAGGAAMVDASGRGVGLGAIAGITSVAGLIADGGTARSGSGNASSAVLTGADLAAATGTITAEGWVNVSAALSVDTRFFACAGNGGLEPLVFFVTATRGLNCYWDYAAGPLQIAFGTAAGLIQNGVRTHVAARRSLSGGTFTVDIFINGVRVAGGTTTNAPNPTNPVYTLYHSNTTLDDWRISKVARTDAEISDSYWRGLLDTTPGPTRAPFRQSRTPYQDYHRQLSPTALLQPNGAAFEAGQGSVKDALFDRCLQAVKAKYPGVAPADALAAIGADRMMPRGGSESDAAYAARLLNAWNVWPWAGTAYGVLQAFYSTGYRNVVLAQVRGGKQFTLDNGGTNLLTYSQDFTQGNWSISGVAAIGGTGSAPVLTRNFAAAPDGTTTATRLQLNKGAGGTANDFSRLLNSNVPFALSPQPNDFAIWLKSNTGATQNVALEVQSGAFATFAVTTAWQRFSVVQSSVSVTPSQGAFVSLRGTMGTDNTCDILIWGADVEVATAPGEYVRTFANTKPTALPAGSLLTTTMGSGIWETDPLSSYSPANQSFWSKFDVLFPLPLMPPSWGWSAGIPSSSSAEANFIRSLAAAWKPAHATVGRIVIGTQGGILGYPATRTLGAGNGVLGGTSVVWSP